MDSIELINMGQQLQEMAAFMGIKCPAFTTGFGIRIVSKILFVLQRGPSLSPAECDQHSHDLNLLFKLCEGEQANAISQMANATDRLVHMIKAKSNINQESGHPVFSDSDMATLEQVDTIILNGRRSSPIQIK